MPGFPVCRLSSGRRGRASATGRRVRLAPEKTLFFRSLRAGRRCAAASRFTFFKGETLYIFCRRMPYSRSLAYTVVRDSRS